MHFTTQMGFRTSIPSIYQPHDLLHLHYPDYFTRAQRDDREFTYRSLCNQAVKVAIMSRWGQRDLIRHYQLPPDKVCIVPWAAVVTAYPSPSASQLESARRSLSLPDAFVFYPAQTWPHKNHLALLDALALLRHRGLDVPLVCSGKRNDFFPVIKKKAEDLGIARQFHSVGFVDPLELQCLYRLARAMVFPTQFEGWGLPINEAFIVGLPVACSRVTCLPELVGDAALLFDPDDPTDIATAVGALWQDKRLRNELVVRGGKRAAQFSWQRTARIFRAHYRQICALPLSKEDHELIRGSAAVRKIL
jgi:glycosyltransferase involved in cell wall biosynthesis